MIRDMNQRRPDVGIVGAGLVGATAACFMARRGFQVTLYESRRDGRNEPAYYGRSINLAMSLRGISALERLGLASIVNNCSIPMRARMIHKPNGQTHAIPYDSKHGRHINSIERSKLNNFLLDRAEIEFGVTIKFNHKLVDIDMKNGDLFFRLENDKLECHHFDLVLGCDGSKSSLRNLMARSQLQMDMSQSYIEHGYVELRMDPKEQVRVDSKQSPIGDSAFKMPKNYLHIWPRGQFMMIALPNLDASFTCTLFCPFTILNKLNEPKFALDFFKLHFKDAIELIGEKNIVQTLSDIRPSPLIEIKCKPYAEQNTRFALLGDSAHAMVPFYGQGMNCGLEDCLVFDELLEKAIEQHQLDKSSIRIGDEILQNRDKLNEILASVLEEYNETRQPNGVAMAELAKYNYIEMRDLVNTISFRVRKQIDNFLHWLLPNTWIPLYTMVTFTRIPVHECISSRQRQDEILRKTRKFLLIFSGIGCVALAASHFGHLPIKCLRKWPVGCSMSKMVCSANEQLSITIPVLLTTEVGSS